MKKRIISMLLSVFLLVSICVIPAAAENGEGFDGSEYQTVFVHGILGFGYNDKLSEIMNYWGMTSGNMMEYLTRQGYDVIDASVGPISSCWDRCCELFAQLTGTVTDYGGAHSAADDAYFASNGSELHHDRYGRDYTGGAIVDNWGPKYENGNVVGWYDNKLNLVAHSMGGPTATLFIQLLAEGNQDEISWGKAQAAEFGGDWHDYVSPLFWGDYDGEYLINSLTTLAGAENGTSIVSCCEDAIELLMTVVGYFANITGHTDIAYLYDFQLEHFGITLEPGQKMTDEEFFNSAKVKQFFASYDCAPFDVTITGTNYMKQGWSTYDNIYYFSYAGNRTHLDSLTGNYVPDADMMLILMPFGAKIGSFDYSFEQVKDINGGYASNLNEAWRPNDGVVNTISARYPIGAANKPYDAENIEAGIWQWQDMRYDHMTFVGGLLDFKVISQPIETKRFYSEIMSNLTKTTPIDNPNADPFNDIAFSGYHDSIVEAAELGIINGYPDGSFRPNANVTRAQFITMLWRTAGSPEAGVSLDFKDGGSIADAYYDAVLWGVDKGIIQGYNDGSFRADESISRAQMATFMYRYLKNVAEYDFGEVLPAGFDDAGSIAAPYRDAVNAIISAGIMNGTGNNLFSPNVCANRGMAATVLLRMHKL